VDPGIALVVSTGITGVLGLAGVLAGVWVSIVKSEDRARIVALEAVVTRLRKKVKSLGGDPDEED
jgi:hypothetical protein